MVRILEIIEECIINTQLNNDAKKLDDQVRMQMTEEERGKKLSDAVDKLSTQPAIRVYVTSMGSHYVDLRDLADRRSNADEIVKRILEKRAEKNRVTGLNK